MRRLTAITLLTVALGACAPSDGGDQRPRLAEPAPTTNAPPPAAEPEPEPLVLIAQADGPLAVRAEPDLSATTVAELAPTTSFGSSRALLVLDQVEGWVRVELPLRPNELSGWVPADQVELVEGRHEVSVDLSDRRLTVLEDGAVLLESPVAVGAPDAPTPTGTFAVIDRLQSPDPFGPYGDFALGLSGLSDVYSEFAGGEGQIGIHGTNDPSSIGQAVSHGCIRLPNDVIGRLADLLPLGTPVTIRS
jgi:lipoprotein-anchoring transpeptidase ErfK/SrfK